MNLYTAPFSMRDLLASGGFRLRGGTRADCARCEGRSRGTVSYNEVVAHCFRCGWAANRWQLARELGQVAQTSVCGFSSDPRRRAHPGRQAFPARHARPGPADGTPQAEACATRGARPFARREARRRAQNEKEIRAFTRWREARLCQVSDRYWGLSRAAVRAAQALAAGATLALDGATLTPDSARRTPAGIALTPGEQELAWDALARFYHAEAELNAAFDLLMCSKAGAWLEDDARIEDLFVLWREEIAQALLPVRGLQS